LWAIVMASLLPAANGSAADVRPPAPRPAARRPVTAPVPAPVFRISLTEDGVYRVNYEDLVSAGLKGTSLASRRLGLFNKGEAVPAWIHDGGDGLFGRGDWLEFVGERLTGETSHYNE